MLSRLVRGWPQTVALWKLLAVGLQTRQVGYLTEAEVLSIARRVAEGILLELEAGGQLAEQPEERLARVTHLAAEALEVYCRAPPRLGGATG